MTRIAAILVAAMTVLAAAGPVRADAYTVTLDPAARDAPASGRLVLFFITEQGGRWDRRQPVRGPFFDAPQPIASVAVTDLAPGESVVIGDEAVAFPGSLRALEGPVRVQALLDASRAERNAFDETGNVVSGVVEVTLAADRPDEVELTLDRPIEPRPMPRHPHVQWVTLRSELLSAHAGRDVFHRAGVALPAAHLRGDEPERRWPAVYVTPGYGGRHEGAISYGEMFRTPGVEDVAPMAVHVVLDPDAPLGHHGFVDSAGNGPRATALVTELIPYLEERFSLDPRPAARIVTGHSSGGWTSLWLVLNHPDTFGACWATAPDPVDFHAFGVVDLYEDENLFVDEEGQERPSMKRVVGRGGKTEVRMTIRQECGMEFAIDPSGRSGQQWDAWEAMFSPLDEATGAPRPLFDPKTGAIDRATVEHWKRFDIARLVASDWERYGPIMMERVHLYCGDEDSFYLDLAVRRLKEQVEAKASEGEGWSGTGYVKLIPFATHNNLRNYVFDKINRQMRAYLDTHGLTGAKESP
jgi:hypothetical protein